MCVSGVGVGSGDTLNFAFYIGYCLPKKKKKKKKIRYIVSHTKKQYPVDQPYPKIYIYADISIPKKYSPCFLFIKVCVSFIFPV